MSAYNKIINPSTGKLVSVSNTLGQSIIKNYIETLMNHGIGGACSACGGTGHNKRTCKAEAKTRSKKTVVAKKSKAPKAPKAPKVKKTKAPKVKKTKAPKAPKVKKTKAPKVKKTKAPRVRKATSLIKKVTTISSGTADRLSAGTYFREQPGAALGDICDIRNNGDLRCLLKRKNDAPYWAKKSKSGKGQKACGDFDESCKFSW